MKIQYCSDLHLEFEENIKLLRERPLQVSGDILILAGDIIPFAIQHQADAFFDLWSAQFEHVFWIAGNHEFYGSDIAVAPNQRMENIRHNVHLINNDVVMLDDLVFIFSTFWSKISSLNELKIYRGMADFRYIQMGDRKFLTPDYNALHEACISFVEEKLKLFQNKKSIVVTHHIPTFLNYPLKYMGDALNEGFATEYWELVEEFGPDIWIYGHHHANVPEFTLGRTRLATNQLGYVKYREIKNFDHAKFFEL